ncbi:hypothetical protein EDB84DRAFT_27487 [Lactarius hengduanensis]|nr:hypothetical protein EDB84DRAFT_27487 [Lactarius hengduanensis]
MEATLVNPTPAPPQQAEAAGPLGHMNYDSLENILASHLSQVQDAASDENSEQNGEQALESHEVIELQAFSERKEWIVEKINLLEGMPPIEVFAGLDAVRASVPAESGLPTREQLKQWLIEHDKIEKETEIFDSGELKKFKKITKAASKRNLSPQDTDIIELTLTTIYEFDKLLHLLRDRSENLDLLGTRLSWEEQRCAAWADHRQLMLDLQHFLSQRSRWSPSVYDALPQAESSAPTPTPTLSRRGSVASLASEASSSSSSGFSRTARFKLGEALSREAAQFAGRISSLRHGKIAAAGKALDKIIENRPVPGELLDEQDKLEEQGVDAMENVGRFIMSVVTQWRKADEFYVETMKDQASAQSLLDDIEAAQLTHPSSRQDSVFSARAGAIIKRLSSRENPCSVISGFPRPTHTLFSDQPSANNSITKVLGEELEIGLSLAARLERSALDYHAACEAVRRAEHSVTSANELTNSYVSVLHHMLNGVDSSDGDGSPPDVTTELCLREAKHAAFLALLPSLSQQLDKSDEEAGSVLPIAQASLLGLADINVEPGFKDRLSSAIQRLEDVRAESENTRAAMTERVNLLRDVRKIWISAGSILKDVGTIRGELDDLMEQQKWKSSTASHLPPTPESVNASLPLSSRTLENATEQVALLQANFDQDVHTGVFALPGVVSPGLRMHLVKCREGLSAILEHSRQMIRLTDNINRQALAMAAIRDETHDLQARLEDTENRFDVLAEQILDGSSLDDLDDLRLDLASDATSIQVACQTFMDSLPHRVVFVSPDSSGTMTSNTSTPSTRRRISPPLDLTLDALPSPPFEPPIDLTHLDHVVRTDCNAFALHIAGGVSSLQRKIAHLDVVQDAHVVDLKLVTLKETITFAEERLEAIRETVSTVPDTFDSINQLARVAGEVGPLFDSRRSEISQSLPPIRQLLHKMEITCSQSPASKHLYLPRSQITDDMEARFQAWGDSAKALLSGIRHREERLRVAQREQIEQERLAAEAEAAEKLAKERAEVEAKQKAEEEREREEAEKAERLRREQAEAEERVRRERAEAARELARKETDVPPSLAFPTANDDIDSSVDNSDVFGSPEPSVDLSQVQLHVAELRRRLRSLGINASVKSSPSSASPLPTVEKHNVVASQLAEVTSEATQLPANISSVTVDAELKSLRDELENSHQLLPRALNLARFGTLVQDCDNALSDLLEHIDSYPAPPSGPLSADYVSSPLLPPEEQLGGRLTFTKNLINNLEEEFIRVADEPRASSERERIVQTWAELESMAFDRINGRKSRPPSTISSGRQSRASVGGPRPSSKLQNKYTPYSSLSARSSTRGSAHAPAPAHPSTSTWRAPHHAPPMPNRSSSRLSVVSSNRSVSGPMAVTSRLFNSTFASRQRTISLSSTTPSPVPNNNPGRRSMEPSRLHTSQQSHLRRTVSPTPSDASGASRSFSVAANPIRPAFGRPPRLSFPSSIVHKSPPKSRPPPPLPRKPYVANPKSKLDVAVGDVVNKLPDDVDIKVEVAHEAWQVRSGKYWIGGEDPKLCFCRILRSHAVMVRVGGGWMELSKFIQTHFADMFRLLPEPMPFLGSREEKWISSSTLLEAPELITPPRPPRTPEPGSGGISLPSFALSTPNGRSPQSIKTHSSPGSPLTALQFLRRVDGEGGLVRPSTPTKGSLLNDHGRSPLPFAPMRSPNRIPVWKP